MGGRGDTLGQLLALLTASLFSILDLSWIHRRANASPVLPRPVAPCPHAPASLARGPGLSLPPPSLGLCPSSLSPSHPPCPPSPSAPPTPACVPTEREVTLSPRLEGGGCGQAPRLSVLSAIPQRMAGTGPQPLPGRSPPSPAPRPCRHKALGRGGDKGLPRAAPACLRLGCHGGPRAPSPLYVYKYNLRNKPETTRDQRRVLAGGTDQSSRKPRSRRAAPLPSHGASRCASPHPAQPSFPSPPSLHPSVLPSCQPEAWEHLCSLALAGDGGWGPPVPRRTETCPQPVCTPSARDCGGCPLGRARHPWVGRERGHGWQLECRAARDHPRGSPLLPELLVPRGDGTPQDRAVVCLVPRGAKGPPGAAAPSVPIAAQGRAVRRGRRLHLPRPCPCPHPWSLSKHPDSPSVSLLVAEGGRTPSLSPTLPRQQPHAGSPATPPGRAGGCQLAPEIQGQTPPGALGQGGRIGGSWGDPARAPRVVGRAGAEQGDAPPGVPRPGGLLVLNTSGTAAPAQPPKALSHPAPPPHPRFRDVPGKGRPGPHPSQRRAVTVTRGSLFIVTNCRN